LCLGASACITVAQDLDAVLAAKTSEIDAAFERDAADAGA
jgi:hypothetical protein